MSARFSTMNYLEYPPHAALRDSVRCLWSLTELHTPQTEVHRIFPERLVRLVFYSGEAYMSDTDGQFTELEPVYLMGFQNQARSMISRGMTQALGVELYPWGALRLLGLQSGVRNLFGRNVEESCRGLARQLEPLLERGDLSEATGLLETWLLGRANLLSQEPTPAIRAATLLYQSGGQGRIADIAERLGLSLRQLERGFVQDVGITPKALARVIRFEEVHNHIWREPKPNLSQLAFDLGYADQAHLTREFQSFAQITPAVFSKVVQTQLKHHMSQVA